VDEGDKCLIIAEVKAIVRTSEQYSHLESSTRDLGPAADNPEDLPDIGTRAFCRTDAPFGFTKTVLGAIRRSSRSFRVNESIIQIPEELRRHRNCGAAGKRIEEEEAQEQIGAIGLKPNDFNLGVVQKRLACTPHITAAPAPFHDVAPLQIVGSTVHSHAFPGEPHRTLA
jgi:hypothetical protein